MCYFNFFLLLNFKKSKQLAWRWETGRKNGWGDKGKWIIYIIKCVGTLSQVDVEIQVLNLFRVKWQSWFLTVYTGSDVFQRWMLSQKQLKISKLYHTSYLIKSYGHLQCLFHLNLQEWAVQLGLHFKTLQDILEYPVNQCTWDTK